MSSRETVVEEVWAGLQEPPRTLNPKWFYDARGSALFDAITQQPEYYPTRAELEILRGRGREISRWIGADAVLAELGAGNGEKAVALLKRLIRPHAYVPVDISSASLETAVHGIRRAMPGIRVEALCLDFMQGFHWPEETSAAHRCLVFFGSTIGNMEPDQARGWMVRMRSALGANDKMLVGVDLVKDASVLNQAYNDRAGVTAAFNLNALTHLNHETGSNWDPKSFRHVAFFNPEKGRVEMHLEAVRPQAVQMGPYQLALEPGERIHTENSYKYSLESFRDLAQSAGFHIDQVWLDGRRWFSLHGLSV
jgi:L-histidine N-alpha-methyltransferase